MASFPGQPEQAGTRKVKQSGFKRLQEMMGMAVASAGSYANNLHLAPHQHLITQFLQAGCPS